MVDPEGIFFVLYWFFVCVCEKKDEKEYEVTPDMQDVVCIFNRGFNRGWADTQGKALLLFDLRYLVVAMKGSLCEVMYT